MFNNNINKPAITVFLPLTSAKTSFCQWQKLVLPGRFFFREKNRFLPVTGKNLPTLLVTKSTMSHLASDRSQCLILLAQLISQ